MIRNFFDEIGQYCSLMRKVFSRPERGRLYVRRTMYELEAIGLNSIAITCIISVFMGAVVTLQLALNFESPFIPKPLIGFATREVMILEFSSTVVALILAGKVGSSIASEIGTMRISEQIDALELMGVNSASYLILPKIVASVMFFPFLCILSLLVGIVGGYAITATTHVMMPADFMEGLHWYFKPTNIYYAMTKIAVFAFLITSISSYCGYFARGNSMEVGRSSTKAVVVSCVAILISDLILTHLMLM